MLYVNVPTWERGVRLVLAVVLTLASVVWFESLWRWAGVASGVGLGLTAVFGWCPACAMVGRRLKEASVKPRPV